MNRRERRRQTNSRQRDRPRLAPLPVRFVNLERGLPTGYMPAEPGVLLKDREGIWVHSFECNHCGLHFQVWSWKPDRHRAETIDCPECGQHDGEFVHYRAQRSELPKRLDVDHPGANFRHFPIRARGI